MEPISLKQMREIYVRASKLGIHNKSLGKDNNLHVMVYRICKKTSIADLSFADAQKVLTELRAASRANAMSAYQQKRAWAEFYKLKKWSAPSGASDGERMAGIVRKACGIRSDAKRPFAFADKRNGNDIIETLKRYSYSAFVKNGKSENPSTVCDGPPPFDKGGCGGTEKEGGAYGEP